MYYTRHVWSFTNEVSMFNMFIRRLIQDSSHRFFYLKHHILHGANLSLFFLQKRTLPHIMKKQNEIENQWGGSQSVLSYHTAEQEEGREDDGNGKRDNLL